MALAFRMFRNRKTGQVCYIEAGRYGNFKNTLKKLVNYVRYNIARYYMAHLILTVAENVSEIDFRDLHRVLQFINKRLERAGSDFKYIAVKEIQDRGAVHCHVLCICSKPYAFPSSDEIAKSWRLGFVKITAPKLRMRVEKIANYIGKYIGKGYEYEALDVRKSFTASQIKQIYKLAPKRLAEVIVKYGKEKAETFKCTYRRVYEMFDNGFRVVKRLIEEFPSDWAYEGVVYEPF